MKTDFIKVHYIGLFPNDLVKISDDLISCKISSNRFLFVKIEIYQPSDPKNEDNSHISDPFVELCSENPCSTP